MEYLYTRAFCRRCRLHFEYASTDVELSDDDPVVLCPLCGRPAQHGPFQPCSAAHYERIELQYERLADEMEERRLRKSARSRPRDEAWDWEEGSPASRKRRR